MCFLWCRNINTLCSSTLKNPDILLSSFAWEIYQFLRENILGPQRKKGGQRIHPPPPRPPPILSSLSPMNTTTQVPLTSQEVELFLGSVLCGCPAISNQKAADCHLQGRRTREWNKSCSNGEEGGGGEEGVTGRKWRRKMRRKSWVRSGFVV